MSARYSTWIDIGGRLQSAETQQLLDAITQALVSFEWDEPPFKPTEPRELLAVLREGTLWLCDSEAKHGEFPHLEGTCGCLGLAYTRYTEGWCNCDAELVDWRPGMDKPLSRTGSNNDCTQTFVLTDRVRDVVTTLEAGEIQKALGTLRELCPEVAVLPPFEIV